MWSMGLIFSIAVVNGLHSDHKMKCISFLEFIGKTRFCFVFLQFCTTGNVNRMLKCTNSIFSLIIFKVSENFDNCFIHLFYF